METVELSVTLQAEYWPHVEEHAVTKKLIDELQSLVKKLQIERQAHIDAISAIDETFQALGITAETKKRGRRTGPGKKKIVARKKIKRQKYKTTAGELVLAVIKKAGSKGATGAQLAQAWKGAGRPGDAYNTLSALLKAKKIQSRQASKGRRGSVYTPA